MHWKQYRDYFENEGDSTSSRSGADTVTHAHVEMLENKIDNLALACQSLWEIIRESTELSEEDLAAKMEEVDLRDGNIDGKITPVAKPCSSCGRKTSRRRMRCVYCGKPTDDPSEVFGRK
jgi:hypothetical protein